MLFYCFVFLSLAGIPGSGLAHLVGHPHYVTTLRKKIPNQYIPSFGSNLPWIRSNEKQRSFQIVIILLMEWLYFLSSRSQMAAEKLGNLPPHGSLTTKTQDLVAFPLPNILSSLILRWVLSNSWHQKNHYLPSSPWITGRLTKEECSFAGCVFILKSIWAREFILNVFD